ncbi:MAG: DMT family transporter, partial [Desulfobacteraceae bacterium]
MEYGELNSRAALSMLLAGAVMISFSSVWVKICQVSPISSAFYRVLFGGLILLGVVLRNREFKWHGRGHFLLVLLCALFFALDLVLYHTSIHFIGPGLGTILPNFQVFILTGFGVLFLNEKIRLRFVLSVPFAFAGLLMIVGIQLDTLDSSYKLGLILGFSAAFFYAGFLLCLRKLQSSLKTRSSFYVLMLVSLVTAMFLAGEMIRTQETFVIPSLVSLASLAALGLLSQGVGFVFITNALPRISASISGLILLAQPAMAFLWDVLFFDRPTDLVNWTG